MYREIHFHCFVEYQRALKDWLYMYWKSCYVNDYVKAREYEAFQHNSLQIVNNLSIYHPCNNDIWLLASICCKLDPLLYHYRFSFYYIGAMKGSDVITFSTHQDAPWRSGLMNCRDSSVIGGGHYPWYWERLFNLLRGDTENQGNKKGTAVEKEWRKKGNNSRSRNGDPHTVGSEKTLVKSHREMLIGDKIPLPT